MKVQNPSSNIPNSQPIDNSCQIQKKEIRISSFFRESLVFECPYCKNILNSDKEALNQCQICGLRILWINDIESRIKIQNDLNYYKNIKRKIYSENSERNFSKINYRYIERQKMKKRESFRQELQKQSRLESQNQILLLNLDYLRRKNHQLNNQSSNPLKPIELLDEKKHKRKMNYLRLESVILLLMLILTIFLSLISTMVIIR
ncbi:MAG: hypothetical protein JSW11_20490 [Candidatus Heimdallarchaeota archaeon]|nr:MAG: hypothetical protein JSW11_20490 [Candidatus Heimdallarchaeota archaeon]